MTGQTLDVRGGRRRLTQRRSSVAAVAAAVFTVSLGVVGGGSEAPAAVGDASAGTGTFVSASAPGRVAVTPSTRRTPAAVVRRKPERASRHVRLSSRQAYRSVTARQAVSIAESKFPEVVGALPVHPLARAGQARPEVRKYLSANEAVLAREPGGGTAARIAVSSEPLLGEDAQGRQKPLDLTLEKTEDGLEPRSAAAPMQVATHIEDGVKMGETGARLVMPGTWGTEVQHTGGAAVWPNAMPDTDMVVRPVPTGVQTFMHVRSPESPERFALQFVLPEGAALEPASQGTALIRRAGEVIATVSAPVAQDADGRNMPVRATVAGSAIVLDAPHRGRDVRYPVMVDPVIAYHDVQYVQPPNAAAPHIYGWAFQQYDSNFAYMVGPGVWGQGFYNTSPYGPRYYHPGSYGGWYFKAPGNAWVEQATFFDARHDTYAGRGRTSMRWGFLNHDRTQWLLASNLYPQSGVYGNVWMCSTSPCRSGWAPPSTFRSNVAYFEEYAHEGGFQETHLNFFASATVTLGDEAWPTFAHPRHASASWTTGPQNVGVQAFDEGVGLERLQIQDADKASGDPENPYSGAALRGWEYAAGDYTQQYVPHVWLDQWIAAEGITSVRAWARDRTLQQNREGFSLGDVKIDSSRPVFSAPVGSLWDQRGGALTSGSKTVSVSVSDGVLGGAKSQRRSGVTKMEVWLVKPGETGPGTQVRTRTQTSCVVNGATHFDSCPMTESYTFDNAASDPLGTYTIRFVATDAAGNTQEWPAWSFTKVDRTDPTVKLGGPATLPLNAGGELHITASDLTDGRPGSGVAHVTVQVDGQTARIYDRPGCAATCPAEDWPVSYTIDPATAGDGIHEVKVTATDKAGNVGHASTKVFVVDLNVMKREQLGLEDFFQYQSTQTGASSRLHVNAATGNAIWHSTPIVNPGRGLSSVVNLTYNSQDRGGLLASLLSASGGAVLLGAPLQDLIGVAYGEVGRGFSIGISGVTRLNEPLAGVVTAGQSGLVRLTDPDGTTHQFTDGNHDGIFDEPPGVQLRLRRFSETDSAKRWAITRPDGVTFFFDAVGYATTVEDRNGNVLRFTYERYSKVTGETAPCQVASPLAEAVCARRVVGVTDAAGVDAAAGQAPDREQRIEARTIKIQYAPGGVVTLPQPIGSVPADLAILGGSAGRIRAIVDHADRKTEFRYDNAGYLTSVTQGVQGGAGGTEDRSHARTFSLGYTADSLLPSQRLLNSIEDPNGNETRIDYAPQALLEPGRRVAKVTDRRGSEWGYSYESRADGKAGSEMKVTDPLPRTLRFRQDTDGRPEVLVDGRGVETRLEWDPDNNVRKLTQAAGTDDEAVTEMEYNGHGQLTKQTDAEDRETTLEYHTSRGTHIGTNGLDDNGGWVSDLRVLTPPGGNATTFTLDGDKGNVLAQAVGELQAATTTYGTRGEILTETDQAGNTTEFLDHDDSGNPRTRIDAERHRWTYEYDAVGNLKAATDPRGVATTNVADDYRTSFVYDPLDRVLESTTPRSSSSGSFITRESTYDDNGNLLTQTDGTGATRTKAYTAMDEPRRDASPPVRHFGESEPAAEVTTQEHDKVGRLVRTIAPNGEGGDSGDWETEQQYDDADRLIVTRRKALRPTPGGQAQIVASMAYDERGNVVGVADPRANASGGDPVTNAADPAKQRFVYTYDRTDNRLTSVEDPDGLTLKTKFAYDENQNLKAETSPRGFAEPPSAVPDANTAEDVEKAFTTTYERDANELITAVTHGNRTTQYDRRADGRVTAITKPEGVASPAIDDFKTTYSYSRTGEVKSWTLPRAEGQYGPAGRGVTYVRNQVGDPETITDPRGNSFTNTFFDTGELKSTQRPSWWKAPEVDGTAANQVQDASLDPLADERAAGMAVQERRYEEWLRDEGDGALPSSEGQGDFGAVERAPDAPVIPRAGATTFGYDNEMRLASVTDARSNEVKLTRDAVGRIVKRERPIGSDMGSQVTEYSFDRNGNLRQTTDPVGALTTRAYDEYDRLVNETAPGASTVAPDPTVVPTSPDVTSTTRYDANGNVRETVNARGKSSLLDYDPVDRPITDQDPEGGVTSFTYDANGNRVRERSPRGNQPDQTLPRERFDTVTAYTVFDEVATHTDGLGATTSYGYNRNGDQTRIEAPGAGTTADSPTAAARVTQREYDGRGLLWKHTVGSAAQSSLATTVTEYDPNGNLRRVIKPEGVAGAAPAGSDSPTQEGDPSGTAGRHATVTVYDAANLRVAEWMPWGERDDEDRVKYRRTFGRDALGRVESLESPFADVDDKRRSARTTYGYYETGWILEATDWHYDSTGTTPTVDQNHTYKYDARGDQVEWLHLQSGRRMTRAYYPNGTLRLRSAREANGQPESRQYTYGHNEVGTLVEMRDHQLGRRTRVEVDDVERTTLVDETWCNGKDTAQAWDLNGNLTRRQTDANIAADQSCGPVSNAGGKTSTFAFDELDRETRMDVAQDGRPNVVRTTTSEYWPSGEMRKRTKANGTVEDWGYRDDGQLRQLRRDPIAEDAAREEMTYQYDRNGNRTLDERGAHAYNARDQLVHWVAPDTDVEYQLNGSGALTRETAKTKVDNVVTDTTVTEHRMVGDRLQTVWVDGVLDKTYHYDDLQNVERIEAHRRAVDEATFEFDAFGRMTEGTSFDAAGSALQTERWAYDGLDRRDFKCLGSDAVDCAGGDRRDHTYVGMSEKLSMHRLDGDPDEDRKTATYDYSSAGERLGQERMVSADPTDWIFRPYATDANGTVEGLEDQNGKVDGPQDDDTSDKTNRYKTNPYGDELNSSTLGKAAQSNPFRFQGFYYDAGLKTYDMQARVYRPDIGRFLSGDRFESAQGDFNLQTDPLTQNRYAFAGGNPVNRIEWDGHCAGPAKIICSKIFERGATTVGKGSRSVPRTVRGGGAKPMRVRIHYELTAHALQRMNRNAFNRLTHKQLRRVLRKGEVFWDTKHKVFTFVLPRQGKKGYTMVTYDPLTGNIPTVLKSGQSARRFSRNASRWVRQDRQ